MSGLSARTRVVRRAGMVGLAVGAVLLAACSDGGSADVATLPPSETRPAASAASDPPPASASASATSPTEVVVTVPPTEPVPTDAGGADTTAGSVLDTAAPTTVLPDGVVGLSADGPWRLVDSAPGVDTPGLVYELMPKLWAFLPTEPSADDGSLFVPQPQDIPIIEAYLQARLVFYEATIQSPMDFANPGWVDWYVDGGETYRDALTPRNDAGQYVDLDVGVVHRPYVLGERRTESASIIFDCELDGGVWRMPDGTLGPGSTPGVVRDGVEATIVRVDGRWMVAHVAEQSLACA